MTTLNSLHLVVADCQRFTILCGVRDSLGSQSGGKPATVNEGANVGHEATGIWVDLRISPFHTPTMTSATCMHTPENFVHTIPMYKHVPKECDVAVISKMVWPVSQCEDRADKLSLAERTASGLTVNHSHPIHSHIPTIHQSSKSAATAT